MCIGICLCIPINKECKPYNEHNFVSHFLSVMAFSASFRQQGRLKLGEV